jgi:putative transposase
VGDGHPYIPHGTWLRLSCHRRRLVQPASSLLASFDHHGSRICVEALEEALAKYGKLEIFNTDQGSQFTSLAFTRVFIGNDIATISMDGKGSWCDNVFVERLWRTVKYEEVYLRAYETVSEARASIWRYLDFCNPALQHPSAYVIGGKRFC